MTLPTYGGKNTLYCDISMWCTFWYSINRRCQPVMRKKQEFFFKSQKREHNDCNLRYLSKKRNFNHIEWVHWKIRISWFIRKFVTSVLNTLQGLSTDHIPNTFRCGKHQKQPSTVHLYLHSAVMKIILFQFHISCMALNISTLTMKETLNFAVIIYLPLLYQSYKKR